MEFSIPEPLIFIPEKKDLPLDWNQIPAVRSSMEFGANLLKSGITCFAVPSVVDPSSLNFVINPLSERFHTLEYRIYGLELDKWILRST